MRLSYTLTPDDIASAHRAFTQTRLARQQRLYLAGGALFLFLCSLSVRGGHWLLAAATGAFGLYCLIFPRFFAARVAASRWAAAHENGDTTLVLSAAGVELDNARVKAKWKWDAFKGTLETPDAWLLLLGSAFQVIPKRAIDSDAQRAELERELARIPKGSQ